MNSTLFKALVAMLPASMLLAGALRFFFKPRAAGSLLQLLGAVSLVLVVLMHMCEGLHLFVAMGWGREHSAGHYLDVASAVLAVTLFPLGYLLHAFTKQYSLAAPLKPNVGLSEAAFKPGHLPGAMH